MGLGLSLAALAVGAVLAFAVDVHPTGLDVPVVGMILMGVGALGLLLVLYLQYVRSAPIGRDRADRYDDHRHAPRYDDRVGYPADNERTLVQHRYDDPRP